MKYLEKFVNYLNESQEDITDLTKEELDDLLIPITDLGIEYSFTEPRVITDGEFSGYKSMNISFKNDFKLGPGGGYTEQIVDERFWDFLDELIALKNRLESARVSIGTDWRHYIIVTFIQKAKVEGDIFKIQKLYNEMSLRTNASKSDFTNNMTKSLDKENLKIVLENNYHFKYLNHAFVASCINFGVQSGALFQYLILLSTIFIPSSKFTFGLQ